MKFQLLILLTLVVLSFSLRVKHQTEEEAKKKLKDFFINDNDLFDTILSKKPFSDEQRKKIDTWMATDPAFSQFLLNQLPADKEEFLAVLRNNTPTTYLKLLFKIEEKKEEQTAEETKDSSNQEAKEEETQEEEAEKNEETKEQKS